MKRILLLAGAVGWGISILGVLLPWSLMNRILQNMGAAISITDPQVQYWFRMATGGWSIIGFFFLMAFLKPEKYKNLVPLLAGASIFEGVLLLFHGMMLNLPLFPFAGDVLFCLIVGVGLIASDENCRGWMKTNYPLLSGRSPDPTAWHLPDIDDSIVAAYLEIIAWAFSLDKTDDLFKLHPDDSLWALYDSYYKTDKFHFMGGVDNLELEEVCEGFEILCAPVKVDFLCEEATIGEQLYRIAKARGNHPVSPKEQKKLCVDLHLLPLITGENQ